MTQLPREDCRESEYCKGKVWYINDTPYNLSQDNRSLKPHTCFNSIVSEFPETVYVGLWKSLSTGRTRYVGPTKKEENARKAPDTYSEWMFLGVMHAKPAWTEMEDKTTIHSVRRNW